MELGSAGPSTALRAGSGCRAGILPAPSGRRDAGATRSEGKFQGELDQPWGLSLKNLIESWRADIAVRETEIRMIEDVEELSPELEVL